MHKFDNTNSLDYVCKSVHEIFGGAHVLNSAFFDTSRLFRTKQRSMTISRISGNSAEG